MSRRRNPARKSPLRKSRTLARRTKRVEKKSKRTSAREKKSKASRQYRAVPTRDLGTTYGNYSNVILHPLLHPLIKPPATCCWGTGQHTRNPGDYVFFSTKFERPSFGLVNNMPFVDEHTAMPKGVSQIESEADGKKTWINTSGNKNTEVDTAQLKILMKGNDVSDHLPAIGTAYLNNVKVKVQTTNISFAQMLLGVKDHKSFSSEQTRETYATLKQGNYERVSEKNFIMAKGEVDTAFQNLLETTEADIICIQEFVDSSEAQEIMTKLEWDFFITLSDREGSCIAWKINRFDSRKIQNEEWSVCGIPGRAWSCIFLHDHETSTEYFVVNVHGPNPGVDSNSITKMTEAGKQNFGVYFAHDEDSLDFETNFKHNIRHVMSEWLNHVISRFSEKNPHIIVAGDFNDASGIIPQRSS